jgi:hypothetical protein
MQLTTIVAAAVFVLSVLIVIAVVMKPQREPTGTYELLSGLLSDGEMAFYRALLAAVSGQYVIAPKVRVADVLKVAGSPQRKGYLPAFNKIAMKHFDFVLCDPTTLAFIGAIELDDKSHQRGKRVSRDKFLEEAASNAKLTLHRFPARAQYAVDDIRTSLFPPTSEVEVMPRLPGRRIEPTL